MSNKEEIEDLSMTNFEDASSVRVDAPVSLLPWLNEEEQWAYENQLDAIKDQNQYELGWNRGYRSAIEQIAKKLKLELKKAG